MYCGIFEHTKRRVWEQDLAFKCAPTVNGQKGQDRVKTKLVREDRQPAC